MKKLLASDYDKTLKCSNIELKMNLRALNKFIESGNIFLLNTGRSYESIKKEIDKYHIKYHYLSCNDGNILFDKDNNILYNSNLSNLIYYELKSLDDNISVKKVMFNNNILEYEVKINKLNELFLLKLEKVMIKYKLCYKVFKEEKVYKLYVYSKFVSKALPVLYVSLIENIKKENIYTIGDNINDLEMLKNYNGYAMFFSKKEVKDVAKGSIINVSRFINSLRR